MTGSSSRPSLLRALAAVALVATLLAPTRALARQVPDPDAANPFRIAWYVLYPVDRLVDLVVFQPINALGRAITPEATFGSFERSGCHLTRPPRSCSR